MSFSLWAARPLFSTMTASPRPIAMGGLNAFHGSRMCFNAAAAAASPDAPNAWVTKIKAEALKMLKLQAILVVVGTAFVLLVFPPPSASEEKRLIAEYERSAGWKT